MERKQQSRHFAISLSLLVAAGALLVPVRFDGGPHVNTARADGVTCYVTPVLKCCVLDPDGKGQTCILNSTLDPVDPEG